MKLVSKKIIKGTITLETGLHIGGSKSSLEIGGIDSPVIKTAKKIPYIPGSSLKGKLRSLLAKEHGASKIEKEPENLKKLFGFSGNNAEITRLYVRDALLDVKHFDETFNKETLDLDYSQEKVENKINRAKGSAEHPRHIERVPEGAIFNFELVLNVYEGDDDYIDLIKGAFNLLEDDYLGGSGSRGYGKVKISLKPVETKNYEQYFGH